MNENTEPTTAEHNPQNLPPATWESLVQLLSTQAMMALGLLPSPGTDQPLRELPLARHYIDLLGVLETKSQGNLTETESKMLGSMLYQLRMAYVEFNKPAGGR